MFLPICGLKTSPIILVKVEPAFFKPSGIRTKQKVPKGVMKLVFFLVLFRHPTVVVTGKTIQERHNGCAGH
jgi:hypothetical protein